MDEMLDGASLYWFTQSFPRAIYGYRQFFGPEPEFFHNNPKYYCKKPMGYSWHPHGITSITTIHCVMYADQYIQSLRLSQYRLLRRYVVLC